MLAELFLYPSRYLPFHAIILARYLSKDNDQFQCPSRIGRDQSTMDEGASSVGGGVGVEGQAAQFVGFRVHGGAGLGGLHLATTDLGEVEGTICQGIGA